MKIIGVYCPYCGKITKFDINSGKKQSFCLHCGQRIILDEEVLYTKSGMNQANAEESVRLKELEISEKQHKQKMVSIILRIVVGALYVLGLFMLIQPILNEGISSGTLLVCTLYLMAGMYGFNPGMFSNKDKNKKN